jgi:hypothetical protein
LLTGFLALGHQILDVVGIVDSLPTVITVDMGTVWKKQRKTSEMKG